MACDFLRRVKRFLKREEWDKERASEIEAYLAIETDENIASGMLSDEARYAAQRKLGNSTLIREEIYHMNSLGFLQTLWQDLRYAARLLLLNPSFALAAILSLALGIGANAAIFQLLDAVRLRTLPVKDAQQLAHVHIPDPHGSGSFVTRYPEVTNEIWRQIQANQQPFSGVFAWGPTTFNLARGGEARNAQGLWVSGDFFSVLGVEPVMGRVLTANDDHAGCGAPGAVISYSFWQHEFGGAPSALGKTVSLNGHPFEIIGITPANFYGVEIGRNFDVAIPLCSEPVTAGEQSQYDLRQGWWLAVMGRLKPGWTIARATAQLRAISPVVFQAAMPPTYNPKQAESFLKNRLEAVPAGSGMSDLRQTYEDPLWLLLGLAGMVLLIACANLANLMLARASAREKEMGIRLAIGATRGRLIRQLLVESLLLSFVGAGLGVFLARVLGQLLVSLLSTQQDPLFVDFSHNSHVLAFTAGLALLTCVLFGLTPALRATHVSPGAVPKASGRGITASRGRFGLRRALVVSQIALSLVLLVGSLLFARSLRNLLTVDAGFREDGILITNVDFSHLHVPVEDRVGFKKGLLDRVRAIPGVLSAADAEIVPISGDGENRTMFTDGSTGQVEKFSVINRVSPGFFATLGTPMLEGRDFGEEDTPHAPLVAVVNQAFADKFFNGADPVGKTFRIQEANGKPQPAYQIVGLVRNTKYYDLREELGSIAYLPLAQRDRQDQGDQFMTRSNLAPAGLIASVKSAVNEVNPDIEVDFQAFHTLIRDSLLRERLMATLSGFFGLLAAILATVGVYGVISYMVARRRNEIGIRMALGANRLTIVKMIMGEAAVLLSTGLALGAVLSLAGARATNALLFGLRRHDPTTPILGIMILASVAAVASYLPAMRAANLDPMAALRDE